MDKLPDLIKLPEMWHPYTPTKANIDAIPIFCGNIGVQEVVEPFPNADRFLSLKELYSKTVEIHPDIDANGDKSIYLTEILWIKHVKKIHFADKIKNTGIGHVKKFNFAGKIKFLVELKGHNLRSIDGKKLVRTNKLVAPS